MKFGRMAALAAGVFLAAGAAGATTIQVPLGNGDTGDVPTWDQSSAPVGAPGGPFETIDPVTHFAVTGVDDSDQTKVEVYDSAVSSGTFDNALTGEGDTVWVTGAPVPHPSIWAMMQTAFANVGATLQRIAASA
jgi:hypothetical protein